MTNEPKWLKKYTSLEYLGDILENNSLHLGDPTRWPDKNDAFAIHQAGYSDPRVLCLTMSADRYHFWDGYGGRREGVCLWFDIMEFLQGIPDDLIHDCVAYPARPDTGALDFASITKPISSAFVKREQYKDEREYRIVDSTNSLNGSLPYPPASLKRIYLNSWLSAVEVDLWKCLIRKRTVGSKLEIWQSRALEHSDWQEALKKVDFTT